MARRAVMPPGGLASVGAPASSAAASAPSTPEEAASVAAPTCAGVVARTSAPLRASMRTVASAPRAHAHRNGVPPSDCTSTFFSASASISVSVADAAATAFGSSTGPEDNAELAALCTALVPSFFATLASAPSKSSSLTAASRA